MLMLYCVKNLFNPLLALCRCTFLLASTQNKTEIYRKNKKCSNSEQLPLAITNTKYTDFSVFNKLNSSHKCNFSVKINI